MRTSFAPWQPTASVGLVLLALTPVAIPVAAAPIPTINTHFLQFGPVVVSQQRVLPLELGNAGDEPWVIQALEFVGGHRADFGCVQGLMGFVVLPGEIVVRDVVFTPGDLGIRAGYFHPVTEFGHPSLISQVIGTGVAAAGIADGGVAPAHGLELGPPTPNPALGRFGIDVHAAHAGAATLAIFDVAGRRVWSFALRLGTSGSERIEWDGRTASGNEAPAGVYLMRLESGSEVAVRTAVLLR
jgi:hypothetical protein